MIVNLCPRVDDNNSRECHGERQKTFDITELIDRLMKIPAVKIERHERFCGFSKVFILSKKTFPQFSCFNCHPRPKSKNEKKKEKKK